MKIYVSAPLFNEMERAFNEKVDAMLQAMGFETYLPQRDGAEAAKLLDEGRDWNEVSRELFELDTQGVRQCDVLLYLLDGRVPDDGASVELGMAYAWGKLCIGFQTDSRRFARGYNNLMLERALDFGIASSWEDLKKLLEKARKHLEFSG
ncbi:MAG: nucleoside 2-deoxyribosyltransferase [Firmicutes bacterium]|nr:nucleoside 2-deoxyribosyltransferase [Bacillota bacterium]